MVALIDRMECKDRASEFPRILLIQCINLGVCHREIDRSIISRPMVTPMVISHRMVHSDVTLCAAGGVQCCVTCPRFHPICTSQVRSYAALITTFGCFIIGFLIIQTDPRRLNDSNTVTLRHVFQSYHYSSIGLLAVCNVDPDTIDSHSLINSSHCWIVWWCDSMLLMWIAAFKSVCSILTLLSKNKQDSKP
eukprot:286386_1